MSPQSKHVPPNAKIIAKHGSKALFGLKDGSTAFFDFETGFSRPGDDADLMAMDGFRSSHNEEWADERIKKFALSKKSLNVSAAKSVKAVQKPRKDTQPNVVSPEEDFVSLLPQQFREWASSYVPGQALPITPPGYKNEARCIGQASEGSFTNLPPSTDRIVAMLLDSLGLPQSQPKNASKEMQAAYEKGLLGRAVREIGVPNILSMVAAARGLWVDKLNKIRCLGGPAANRFTNIFGVGCDIPSSPEELARDAASAGREAAGDAGRALAGARERVGEARERLGETRERIGETTATARSADGDLVPFSSANFVPRSSESGWLEVDSGAMLRYGANPPIQASYRFPSSQEIDKNTNEAFGRRIFEEAKARTWISRRMKELGGGPRLLPRRKKPSNVDETRIAAQAVVEYVENVLNAPYLARQLDGPSHIIADVNDPLELAKGQIQNPETVIEQHLRNAVPDGDPKKLAVAAANYATILENFDRTLKASPELQGIPINFAPMKDMYDRTGNIAILTVNGFANEQNRPSSILGDIAGTGSFPVFGPSMAGVNVAFIPTGTPSGVVPAPGYLYSSDGFYSGVISAKDKILPFHTFFVFDERLLTDPEGLFRTFQPGESHLSVSSRSPLAMLQHTLEHEPQHLAAFTHKLRENLGYTQKEFAERLKRQFLYDAAGRILGVEQSKIVGDEVFGPIDLFRDARRGTFLRRQIDELMIALRHPMYKDRPGLVLDGGLSGWRDTDPKLTIQEKIILLWKFYANNIRWDNATKSNFIHETTGVLQKKSQQALLQEIDESLKDRGFLEGTRSLLVDTVRTHLASIPDYEMDPTLRYDERRILGVGPLDQLHIAQNEQMILSWMASNPGSTRDDAVRSLLASNSLNILPASGPRVLSGERRLTREELGMAQDFVGNNYALHNLVELDAEFSRAINDPDAEKKIKAFLTRNAGRVTEDKFYDVVEFMVGRKRRYELQGRREPAVTSLPPDSSLTSWTPPAGPGPQGSPGGNPPGGGLGPGGPSPAAPGPGAAPGANVPAGPSPAVAPQAPQAPQSPATPNVPNVSPNQNPPARPMIPISPAQPATPNAPTSPPARPMIPLGPGAPAPSPQPDPNAPNVPNAPDAGGSPKVPRPNRPGKTPASPAPQSPNQPVSPQTPTAPQSPQTPTPQPPTRPRTPSQPSTPGTRPKKSTVDPYVVGESQKIPNEVVVQASVVDAKDPNWLQNSLNALDANDQNATNFRARAVASINKKQDLIIAQANGQTSSLPGRKQVVYPNHLIQIVQGPDSNPVAQELRKSTGPKDLLDRLDKTGYVVLDTETAGTDFLVHGGSVFHLYARKVKPDGTVEELDLYITPTVPSGMRQDLMKPELFETLPDGRVILKLDPKLTSGSTKILDVAEYERAKTQGISREEAAARVAEFLSPDVPIVTMNGTNFDNPLIDELLDEGRAAGTVDTDFGIVDLAHVDILAIGHNLIDGRHDSLNPKDKNVQKLARLIADGKTVPRGPEMVGAWMLSPIGAPAGSVAGYNPPNSGSSEFWMEDGIKYFVKIGPNGARTKGKMMTVIARNHKLGALGSYVGEVRPSTHDAREDVISAERIMRRLLEEGEIQGMGKLAFDHAAAADIQAKLGTKAVKSVGDARRAKETAERLAGGPGKRPSRPQTPTTQAPTASGDVTADPRIEKFSPTDNYDSSPLRLASEIDGMNFYEKNEMNGLIQKVNDGDKLDVYERQRLRTLLDKAERAVESYETRTQKLRTPEQLQQLREMVDDLAKFEQSMKEDPDFYSEEAIEILKVALMSGALRQQERREEINRAVNEIISKLGYQGEFFTEMQDAHWLMSMVRAARQLHKDGTFVGLDELAEFLGIPQEEIITLYGFLGFTP